MIREAHARGMEVHPAVSCMLGGSRGLVKKTLLDLHPEWLVRDQDDKPIFDGNAAVADVHRPEFRKHFIQFVAGVARKYPVDGIHLDFTRAVQLCLCQKCRDEYHAAYGGDLMKDGGKPSVQAWQEKAVSELVKGIREALNEVRPGIKLPHWGTDDPGSFSIQGRRPDIWLNNDWIDWYEVDCYGEDPDQAIMGWLENAKMVKSPNRVWPTLGMYNSQPGPTAVELNRVTVTGDPNGAGWGRKPEALIPMYEGFRDRCKVNGFSFFDLTYTTDDIPRGMKELILKEKAIPWYPKSGQ